jgi:hypothetical protein
VKIVLTQVGAANSTAIVQMGLTGPLGSAGPPGDDGPPGPAPAGTGLVSVTDGKLDAPTTLLARLTAEPAAARSAIGAATADEALVGVPLGDACPAATAMRLIDGASGKDAVALQFLDEEVIFASRFAEPFRAAIKAVSSRSNNGKDAFIAGNGVAIPPTAGESITITLGDGGVSNLPDDYFSGGMGGSITINLGKGAFGNDEDGSPGVFKVVSYADRDFIFSSGKGFGTAKACVMQFVDYNLILQAVDSNGEPLYDIGLNGMLANLGQNFAIFDGTATIQNMNNPVVAVLVLSSHSTTDCKMVRYLCKSPAGNPGNPAAEITIGLEKVNSNSNFPFTGYYAVRIADMVHHQNPSADNLVEALRYSAKGSSDGNYTLTEVKGDLQVTGRIFQGPTSTPKQTLPAALSGSATLADVIAAFNSLRQKLIDSTLYRGDSS